MCVLHKPVPSVGCSRYLENVFENGVRNASLFVSNAVLVLAQVVCAASQRRVRHTSGSACCEEMLPAVNSGDAARPDICHGNNVLHSNIISVDSEQP